MVLVGAVAAATVLALATLRQPARPGLARATFATLLVVAVPAWVVMRIGGQWILSKEDYEKNPGWVGVGFAVAEPGLVLLLLALALAWWSTRRQGRGWQARAVAVLTTVYLLALGVAWWAMSAKP
jgi:hypothetical protein